MHRIKGARASSKYDFENNKQEAAEIKKKARKKHSKQREVDRPGVLLTEIISQVKHQA